MDTASPPEALLAAAGTTNTPSDRVQRVRFGERWLTDAWELFHVPSGVGVVLVDMTQTRKTLRILREGRIPATYPHLIIRAVALAYSRDPSALRIVCNYRRMIPGALDVGLSMAGQTTYSPVVVIPAVNKKPLAALIPAITQAIDAAAAREAGDLKLIYRMAIPFRWFRLWVLRRLHRSLRWRTRIVGHFQVTCLTNVDVAVPLAFYSSGILAVGAIRDRVVASDGVPVVRPTLWLSGVADHASTDGSTGVDALGVIREILEGEELVAEAREAVALKAAATKGPS
jgi:hypothetical protein